MKTALIYYDGFPKSVEFEDMYMRDKFIELCIKNIPVAIVPYSFLLIIIDNVSST
jgi:hypothetical protein